MPEKRVTVIYNFEYELKLMLKENEYESLIMTEGCEPFRQINYYFDTAEFDLFKRQKVVRIRENEKKYELTIKTKNESDKNTGVVAMNEHNRAITEETARNLISGDENIRIYLPEDILPDNWNFNNTGSITTFRKKIRICEGLPMAELDKSIYDGVTDYELEWEISEKYYDEAVSSLLESGISLEDRKTGMSKYGRLVDRLRKDI